LISARGIGMRCFVLLAVVFANCLCAAAGAQAAEPSQAPSVSDTPEQWRSLARQDLDAAREVLASQTPIPFDDVNPVYRKWLDQGYAQARVLADQVTDAQGLYYTIAYYLHGFADPHISANPVGELPAPLWPGFIVASRAGEVVVKYRDESDPTVPPLGARVVGCDERTLDELIAQRLYPYVLNRKLELDRRRAPTRLFLERGIPAAPAPVRCRFFLHRSSCFQMGPARRPASTSSTPHCSYRESD